MTAADPIAVRLTKLMNKLELDGLYTDSNTCWLALEALAAAEARIAETRKKALEALSAVKTWAEQKCPCRNEEPNPCPLCGASVENLEPCKAVDLTFPRLLRENIAAAIRSLSAEEAKP